MKTSFQRFVADQPLAEQLTASRLNEIQDEILKRTPTEGVGTRLTKSPRGFSYSSRPGGGGGRTQRRPLQCVPAPDNAAYVEPSIVIINGKDFIPTIEGVEITETGPGRPSISLDDVGEIQVVINLLWTTYNDFLGTQNYSASPVVQSVKIQTDQKRFEASGGNVNSQTTFTFATVSDNKLQKNLFYGPLIVSAGPVYVDQTILYGGQPAVYRYATAGIVVMNPATYYESA